MLCFYHLRISASLTDHMCQYRRMLSFASSSSNSQNGTNAHTGCYSQTGLRTCLSEGGWRGSRGEVKFLRWSQLSLRGSHWCCNSWNMVEVWEVFSRRRGPQQEPANVFLLTILSSSAWTCILTDWPDQSLSGAPLFILSSIFRLNLFNGVCFKAIMTTLKFCK